MSFKRFAVAGAVALSMTGAPVLAQSAAPLSVVTSVDRSGARIHHASNLDRKYLVGLAFFAAVIAAIVLLGGGNGHDLPASA
jgi:hypothetical protein